MSAIKRVLEVMASLRDPQHGCPWDKVQTWETLPRHTLEEAYEVADAATLGDAPQLRDELGDLLFQVIFYAQIASEQGLFDFEAIVDGLADKLVRRHPHVFEPDSQISRDELNHRWEAQKARERDDNPRVRSQLDDVPRALPALSRAQKLQKRAARVGFDWPDIAAVLKKVSEELRELSEAIAARNESATQEELGDLLFTVVNLARHLNEDAETALRKGNDKFERRFRAMEDRVSVSGTDMTALDDDAWDAHWNAVKNGEQVQP